MSHHSTDLAVKLGNDHLAQFHVTVTCHDQSIDTLDRERIRDRIGSYIPMYQQLADQEFGIFTLRERSITSSKLSCDHPSLLSIGILDGRLNDANGIMFEDEVVDTTRHDIEQLGHQLFALGQRHMRFSTQPLP